MTDWPAGTPYLYSGILGPTPFPASPTGCLQEPGQWKMEGLGWCQAPSCALSGARYNARLPRRKYEGRKKKKKKPCVKHNTCKIYRPPPVLTSRAADICARLYSMEDPGLGTLDFTTNCESALSMCTKDLANRTFSL
jgi:hypothetical protein